MKNHVSPQALLVLIAVLPSTANAKIELPPAVWGLIFTFWGWIFFGVWCLLTVAFIAALLIDFNGGWKTIAWHWALAILLVASFAVVIESLGFLHFFANYELITGDALTWSNVKIFAWIVFVGIPLIGMISVR